MSAARRRILIVAYFYPPLNIIGARRPHALAKYLSRAGHEVAVLTSLQSGHGEDPARAATRLVRTRDLLATDLNWRRGNFEAITGQAGTTETTWVSGPNLWGSLFIPDLQLLSWVPFALRAAERLRRSFRPDVVITTSPVESAHVIGRALQARGVPWIADMRDGWRFEAPREDFPLRGQRCLDDWFERRLLTRADAVVMVTRPLAEEMRGRLGVDPHVITNGFDPSDAPQGSLERGLLDDRKLSLVHTGGFGHRKTLEPVLRALALLARTDAGLSQRIELVLAGPLTATESELHRRPEYAPFIRALGFVERPVALALQRHADWLLLITEGERVGEATGKLFEYLAAGPPILALAAGSAAGVIVDHESAGLVVPPRDDEAVLAAVRRILAGDETAVFEPRDRSHYLYPALAVRYGELIEEVVAQRAAGGASPAAASTPAPTR